MEGKWIDGLTPEMDVLIAARKVLSARIDAVRYWLPLVGHAEKDPEFVHQLRVTTRRAGAALRLFRGCLRSKPAREARRLLRELRQTAGEARDWDVFLETLFSIELGEGALRDFLFGFAVSRRMHAQLALSRMAFDGRRPLDTLRDQLDDLLNPDVEEIREYGELCLRSVRELINELHAATHPVPEDYHALHQVRIIGKRLRYVLELAVDCLHPPVRETLLPKIEEMQKVLGEANDAHVLSERLSEMGYFVQQFRPAEFRLIEDDLEELASAQKEKLVSRRGRFLEWLKTWDTSEHLLQLRSSLIAH